jgi:DNA-binding beta-propeller fold protein YncE
MKHVSFTALAAAAVGTLLALPSFAAGPEFKVVQHVKMPDGDFDYGSVDSGNGRVYWSRDGEITMLNVKTGQLTKLVGGAGGHVAVPVPGTDLIVEPHGAPNGADSGIAVIDVKANKIVADIPAGRAEPGAPPSKKPAGFPDGATYDPASKLVYVMTHFDAVAYAVDARTGKLVAKIATDTDDQEFPAADGKGHLFVASPGSKAIAVIDTKAQKLMGKYTLACGASGMAYASKSGLLIAECDDDGLAEIVDAKTGKTIAEVKIGHGADSVQYDAKDQLAMVPCQEEGKLYVISVADPKHVALVQTLDTAKGTRTGAWDNSNDRGYYMAGQATDKHVHGHTVLAQGSLEQLVVGK